MNTSQEHKLDEQIKYLQKVHIWSNEIRKKLIRQLLQAIKDKH